MTAKFLTRSAIPGREKLVRSLKRVKEGLTIEDFILTHTIRIPVATEADDDQALFLRHDGLVDVPAADKMGKYDRTHGVWC